MIKKWLKSLVGKRSDTAEEQQFSVGSCVVNIGRFTYGTKRMKVIDWGEGSNLTIGSFCSVASGLRILMGGNHHTDWISMFPFGVLHQDVFTNIPPQSGKVLRKGSKGDVQIGHDVWIGMDVTIMSGVTVGDGAAIAANATVAKDIGPYEIWGGNPAKLIRKRFDDETIAALIALKWWSLPLEEIKEISPVLCERPSPEALATLKDMT